MEHDAIRHKLSEYIDGAITAREKAEIEEHLKSCAQCGSALAELQKTIEQVKQIEDVEPPAWMTQKIMARVRAEAEQKKSIFQRLFYPLAVKLPIQAVAVLFLAVTAFYIYRSIQPEMRYAEAPVSMSETKKEAPAMGAAESPPSPNPLPSGERAKVRGKEVIEPKQAPQAPGYKALDMKQEYEVTPVPTPKEETAAPAPAKPVDKFSALNRASAEKGPAAAAAQSADERSSGFAHLKAKSFSDACLSYEPAVVKVYGVINKKDFPGPPNYESIAEGDEREAYWILKLDKPACVSGNIDDINEPESDITDVQLVLNSEQYDKYRSVLSKPVIIVGTLFHSHTGHHHTRMLLTVLEITERQ